jgi:hypothetical protein
MAIFNLIFVTTSFSLASSNRLFNQATENDENSMDFEAPATAGDDLRSSFAC